MAGTRDRPGPELPWLGKEGRLKSIKNWLCMCQGTDPDRLRKEEQTQQRAPPVVRTDLTASHDGVALENSDKISRNWGDYY